MVTSDERVLAVGECAQHRGVVHGIVAPIYEQAEVAAATLTSGDERYKGSVPSAKLKVMGVDLVSVGAAEGARSAVSRRPSTAPESRSFLRREHPRACDRDGVRLSISV